MRNARDWLVMVALAAAHLVLDAMLTGLWWLGRVFVHWLMRAVPLGDPDTVATQAIEVIFAVGTFVPLFAYIYVDSTRILIRAQRLIVEELRGPSKQRRKKPLLEELL